MLNKQAKLRIRRNRDTRISRVAYLKLYAKMRAAKDKSGYVMVYDKLGEELLGQDVDVVYSVGMADDNRFDFIMFGLTSTNVTECVIEAFKAGKIVFDTAKGESEVFQPEGTHLRNEGGRLGDPLRMKLLMSKGDTVAQFFAHAALNPKLRVTPPKGFYQIIWPDANNILQGEEGFNMDMLQPDIRELTPEQYER